MYARIEVRSRSRASPSVFSLVIPLSGRSRVERREWLVVRVEKPERAREDQETETGSGRDHVSSDVSCTHIRHRCCGVCVGHRWRQHREVLSTRNRTSLRPFARHGWGNESGRGIYVYVHKYNVTHFSLTEHMSSDISRFMTVATVKPKFRNFFFSHSAHLK